MDSKDILNNEKEKPKIINSKNILSNLKGDYMLQNFSDYIP